MGTARDGQHGFGVVDAGGFGFGFYRAVMNVRSLAATSY